MADDYEVPRPRLLSTHYVGCWQSHHECAMAEVKRLRDRLAECERSLDMWDLGQDSEYWVRHPTPIAAES